MGEASRAMRCPSFCFLANGQTVRRGGHGLDSRYCTAQNTGLTNEKKKKTRWMTAYLLYVLCRRRLVDNRQDSASRWRVLATGMRMEVEEMRRLDIVP
jgi:hypothetical protein